MLTVTLCWKSTTYDELSSPKRDNLPQPAVFRPPFPSSGPSCARIQRTLRREKQLFLKNAKMFAYKRTNSPIRGRSSRHFPISALCARSATAIRLSTGARLTSKAFQAGFSYLPFQFVKEQYLALLFAHKRKSQNNHRKWIATSSHHQNFITGLCHVKSAPGCSPA
jgi:hypothetical protein